MSGAAALRPAGAPDLPALRALLAELGLPVAGVEEWVTRFTVAERSGEIVGAAGVEIYEGGALLRSVAVRPAVRGGGLGRALVRRALDTARASGAREVYLLTTTAERYFPRLGFAEVPRARVPASVQASVEFREACPASAIAMRLALEA